MNESSDMAPHAFEPPCAWMNGEERLMGAVLACRFFGLLFRAAPGKTLLRSLRDQGLLTNWPLAGGGAQAERGLGLMRGFLCLPVEEAVSLTQREFAELFVGPEQPLNQWESVWTSREKLLFGESTLAVREAYACYGMETPGPEPDDHISLEMTFLGELLGRAAEASGQGDAAGAAELIAACAAFYATHPARWAKLFLRELEARAATDFYRGAAMLCAATLDSLEGSLFRPRGQG